MPDTDIEYEHSRNHDGSEKTATRSTDAAPGQRDRDAILTTDKAAAVPPDAKDNRLQDKSKSATGLPGGEGDDKPRLQDKSKPAAGLPGGEGGDKPRLQGPEKTSGDTGQSSARPEQSGSNSTLDKLGQWAVGKNPGEANALQHATDLITQKADALAKDAGKEWDQAKGALQNTADELAKDASKKLDQAKDAAGNALHNKAERIVDRYNAQQQAERQKQPEHPTAQDGGKAQEAKAATDGAPKDNTVSAGMESAAKRLEGEAAKKVAALPETYAKMAEGVAVDAVLGPYAHVPEVVHTVKDYLDGKVPAAGPATVEAAKAYLAYEKGDTAGVAENLSMSVAHQLEARALMAAQLAMVAEGGAGTGAAAERAAMAEAGAAAKAGTAEASAVAKSGMDAAPQALPATQVTPEAPTVPTPPPETPPATKVTPEAPSEPQPAREPAPRDLPSGGSDTPDLDVRNRPFPQRTVTTSRGEPSAPEDLTGTDRRTGMAFNERNAAEIVNNLRIEYDSSAGRPVRVSYNVDSNTVRSEAVSKRSFTGDRSTEGAQGTNAAYAGSGYDRGHLAQREAFKGSKETERAADMHTNIVPMTPELNRGAGSPWREAEARTVELARERGSVRVEIEVHYAEHPPTLRDGTPIPDSFNRRVIAPDGTMLRDDHFNNRVARPAGGG
jgi:hypothetical protein